jgi:YD repeat-containing protein
VDANGNRREFTYNTGSTTVTIKDSSQNAVYSYTVGYNADMGETTRTDGKGTTIRTLTYSDPLNRYCPSSVTDGNNNVWYYSWDSVGHLRTVITPRGITTTLNEDYFNFPLGELTSVQTTGKQATSFTYYEPSGLLHTITSPKPGTSNGGLNVTTSFTYDSLGNVLTITAPGNDATANIVTTFNYTTDGTYSQAAAIGQPLTVTDNLGKVTHLRYYTSGYNTGDLSSVTDALGNQTTFSYNIVNQPT